jgi:para-nitrobenzyl esterase
VKVAQSAHPADSARVRVHSGVLAGSVQGEVRSFKGIPYAAPPIGPLRWKRPQPAESWSGERDATDFGPSCMQAAVPRNVPAESRAAKLSEDCLTLNVWAPTSARNAPVMVWLHGGGNVDGSSADRYYDGTAFARDGIVLVSLNYRLGVLGFAAFDGESNFGLWDQVAALRWVRENIAAFGGDPRNVTLFGESAGGEDAIALMTAAPAHGLFQKVIAESPGGGWGPPPSLSDAEDPRAKLANLAKMQRSEMVGAQSAETSRAQRSETSGAQSAETSRAQRSETTGAQSAETLSAKASSTQPSETSAAQSTEASRTQPSETSTDPRSVPAETLIQAQTQHGDWGPVIDGYLLTEPPLHAIAAGHAARIPLIIGTNGEEGSVLGREPHANSVFPQLSANDLAQLKTLYGTQASDDATLARLIFRDGYFAGPSRWIAAQFARHSEPVYAYRFNYVATILRGRRDGAYHGSEIPFVFERSIGRIAPPEEDRRVARALHDCWVAFARTSKPTCAEAPGWTRFDGTHWMVFDAQPSMRSIQDSAALDLLQGRLSKIAASSNSSSEHRPRT